MDMWVSMRRTESKRGSPTAVESPSAGFVNSIDLGMVIGPWGVSTE
jgi:hypothetical protein